MGAKSLGTQKREKGLFQHAPRTPTRRKDKGTGHPTLGVHRPSISEPVQLRPPSPKRGSDFPEVAPQAKGMLSQSPVKPRGAPAASWADPTPHPSAGDSKDPGQSGGGSPQQGEA